MPIIIKRKGSAVPSSTSAPQPPDPSPEASNHQTAENERAPSPEASPEPQPQPKRSEAARTHGSNPANPETRRVGQKAPVTSLRKFVAKCKGGCPPGTTRSQEDQPFRN